jgi:hypothetical protein
MMEIEIKTKYSDGHTEAHTIEPGAKRKPATSSAVKRRYNTKVYDEVRAQLPKALVSEFRERLAARGDTVAGVLREAITAYLTRTSGE